MIEAKITDERKRVVAAREAKSEPTIYKTEPEIFQIERCFVEALDEVAPGTELRGLTAFEYCTMCFYYDSQAFPTQFLAKCADNEDDGPADSSNNSDLDSVLADLATETQ